MFNVSKCEHPSKSENIRRYPIELTAGFFFKSFIGTSDVIRAVNFARENNLEISVKGGGHNSAGTAVSDGGFMIDLSMMRRVTVNKENKTARVDGGCLLGDVDHETQLHGVFTRSTAREFRHQ
jgi:UDP-N-acetylenolpyruvoylglucosamine reductase